MTSWLAALSQSPGSVDPGRNMPLRLAVIATTLLGACTFSGDQWRSRFRFFAERGVSARMVWLARLTFWSVAALVWCGIVWQFATAQATHVPATPTLVSASGQPAAGAVAGVFVAPGVQPQFAEWLAAHAGPTLAEAMIGLALIGFVVGQWTSMRIRSPIAAVFAAGILATLAVLWSMWMARLRVPLWFSVFPLAPILLFSSWLTAPDWLLEREGRRVWKRDALTLYLPLLAMLLGFAAYRAWEIPAHLMPGDPAVSVLNWGPRGNESAPTTLSGADTARLRSEMRTAIDEIFKPQEQLLSGDAGAWGGRPFAQRLSLFLMPWETARTKRLIEREREILTKRVDQAIARLCSSVPLHTERDNFDSLDHRVLDVFTQQYRETTRLFEVSPVTYSHLAARLGRAESLRRLAATKHALEAYRKQHGEWPDRLEQLVPEHLPAVPVDPYTGLPMLYVRGGLSRTLTLPNRPELTQAGDEARELGFDRENVELPAGEPFLWLAGEKVVASPLYGQGGPAVQSYWFMRTANRYDDRMH
ncbi:MAG TPA: hypothetical protein PLV92_21525, partial [Pirellulaceae bacterium]|nr:hypothetical protein [Pirellulaceae bacterium]